MKMLAACLMASTVAVLVWPRQARGQTADTNTPPAPTKAILSVFSDENRSKLCNSDNRVRSTALLGELAKVYQVNLFALPDVPKNLNPDRTPKDPVAGEVAVNSYGLPIERRAAYWIWTSNKLGADKAKALGVGAENGQMKLLKFDLVNYVFWLAAAKDGTYRLAPSTVVGDYADLEDRDLVVESMLDPARRPDAEPIVGIACVATAPKDASKPVQQGKQAASEQMTFTWALRGSIDELAVPREERSDAFKKTTDAKLAYTVNGVKQEESVVANVTLGLGVELDERDAILGFARYSQSSTETRVAGDEDDSKDIHAVSAGVLVRRSLRADPVFAQLGVTAYQTWDHGQDSELIRIRAFAEDIALRTPAGNIVCGGESSVGPFYLSCKAGAFAEKGRVLERGRSLDFADTADDDYAGLGADLSLSTWFTDLKPLSRLLLTAQYKKMWILDGDLRNPDRFLIELAYKFPNSDVSLALSRTYGENFDTFQKEEVNLLSVGFKY